MIILYTTNCPNCKMLKMTLQEHGVEFEENTSIDEMCALGFNRVPMLKISDDEVLDYKSAMQWAQNQ